MVNEPTYVNLDKKREEVNKGLREDLPLFRTYLGPELARSNWDTIPGEDDTLLAARRRISQVYTVTINFLREREGPVVFITRDGLGIPEADLNLNYSDFNQALTEVQEAMLRAKRTANGIIAAA